MAVHSVNNFSLGSVHRASLVNVTRQGYPNYYLLRLDGFCFHIRLNTKENIVAIPITTAQYDQLAAKNGSSAEYTDFIAAQLYTDLKTHNGVDLRLDGHVKVNPDKVSVDLEGEFTREELLAILAYMEEV